MNEERAPVSFRAAKPVDKKTRHPFSGEPLARVELDYAGEQLPAGEHREAPDPYKLVLDDLHHRRDEIDRAIKLIESLR